MIYDLYRCFCFYIYVFYDFLLLNCPVFGRETFKVSLAVVQTATGIIIIIMHVR